MAQKLILGLKPPSLLEQIAKGFCERVQDDRHHRGCCHDSHSMREPRSRWNFWKEQQLTNELTSILGRLGSEALAGDHSRWPAPGLAADPACALAWRGARLRLDSKVPPRYYFKPAFIAGR